MNMALFSTYVQYVRTLIQVDCTNAAERTTVALNCSKDQRTVRRKQLKVKRNKTTMNFGSTVIADLIGVEVAQTK